MSLRFRVPMFACGVAAAIVVSLLVSPVGAATYYWTTAGSGNSLTAGNGTWDTVSSFWATDTTGATVGPWSGSNTDTADFYGTRRNVRDQPQRHSTAGNITFDGSRIHSSMAAPSPWQRFQQRRHDHHECSAATIGSVIGGSAGLY